MQLRTRQVFTVAAVALGFVVTLAGSAQAQGNSRLGTWTRNVAQSTFDPGPPPKREGRVYEAWEGDGIKTTTISVRADGTRSQTAYSAHYDGKDYKYTGSVGRDGIALKRVDANTTEAVLKKEGKVVQTSRTVIANGGKTMTITGGAGIGRDGQKTNKTVQVYEKQ